MRVAVAIAALLSGLFLTGACTSDGRSESRNIGGCTVDTIPLDMTVVSSCDATSSHLRISILSVERAPDETYRAAAAGLASLLDSLGIGICGVPQLVVIREGPCWPRHRIDIRLESGSEKSFPVIRSALAGGTLAGLRPSENRPEGYGTFFVQAAAGSTDRWTLWYALPQP